MSENLQLIPLDAIDEGALIRDRTVIDEEAMGELSLSIATGGLRMPIEVFALEEPKGACTHGLISGLRRLTGVPGAAGGDGGGAVRGDPGLRAGAERTWRRRWRRWWRRTRCAPRSRPGSAAASR